MDSRQVLVMGDLHVPYEHKGAVELTLQIAEDLAVDEIVLNGDIADVFNLNTHGPNKDIKESLQQEVDAMVYFLLSLRERFPNTTLTMLCGNHEFRLNRYLQNRAPELYGMLSIKELFFLDDYGYNYIDYGANQAYELCEGLIVRHEPIAGGVHFAHGTLVKGGTSTIVNHVHRVQHTNLHLLDGRKLSCWGIGWLGDKRHPVFNYLKNHANWDLAFGLVTIVDKKFYVEVPEIQEQCGILSCICNGDYWEY